MCCPPVRKFWIFLESVSLNLVLERTRLNYARGLIVPKSQPAGRHGEKNQHYAAVVTESVFEFSKVFDADYLYFYGPHLEAVSDAQAATIWRLLGLEPGMRVLDLACGHGRIANRLAERGARVTGVDATPLFLEHARRDAAERGVKVDYVSGDMRSLPWPQHRFERVISWFTSFGYFGDDDNHKVLAEAYRVLRPGGRLLIENNNLAELLPRWLPAVVVERDENLMIDRSIFDPMTGRAVTQRTCVRDGQVRRFRFAVRMFIGVELKAWLLATGFHSVDQMDHEGAALGARSGRMVSIAHKASVADESSALG